MDHHKLLQARLHRTRSYERPNLILLIFKGYIMAIKLSSKIRIQNIEHSTDIYCSLIMNYNI
jgi:hypothetical protein